MRLPPAIVISLPPALGACDEPLLETSPLVGGGVVTAEVVVVVAPRLATEGLGPVPPQPAATSASAPELARSATRAGLPWNALRGLEKLMPLGIPHRRLQTDNSICYRTATRGLAGRSTASGSRPAEAG